MPICTICGQEVQFIPQYQQWYCPNCRTYPYLQQADSRMYVRVAYPNIYYGMQQAGYQQGYPPIAQFQQPPVVGPNPVAARAKIHQSFMMRQSTDSFISSTWVWAIVLFQIVFPLLAVIAVLLLVQNVNLTVSNTGFLVGLLLAVLLVTIALAVSHAILVHKLVKRRDGHFNRDGILNDGLTEYLGAVALSTGVDLNVERWTMNSIVSHGYMPDRSASLWAMLVALIAVIPVIGIIFLVYCQLFLTRDIHLHDEKQRAFLQQYQMGMMKAGKTSPANILWQPLPKRDTAAYVVMTILTLGLFLPYWWYVNIVDMNTHMRNQWEFENALVESIREEG